jgi:hypothetical protein
VVALLLYAYARGNRSSRGIERACQEDVTYKVITAMRVPDHSTIAEFRRRHEQALADLFTSVLALCREAGLVEVGVISIDGMKIRANASRGANRTYEKLVADILKEAEQTDRWEDGLFGEDRGDELPEHLQTEEGRRAAFKAAKERLVKKADRGEELQIARVEPDPERFESTRVGVGERGIARLKRSCCAGVSRRLSRSRGSARRGCWRRCTGWTRTGWSRSRPARPMSAGKQSGAPAGSPARGSGCHRSPTRRRRYLTE